jgi:hypothetical protein
MIEQLEIVEDVETANDNDIINHCRRELARLFLLGGGLVFTLGQAMSVLEAG